MTSILTWWTETLGVSGVRVLGWSGSRPLGFRLASPPGMRRSLLMEVRYAASSSEEELAVAVVPLPGVLSEALLLAME